ncbi:uncharacterized protein An03g00470 [Aspergillus niger]|uniref:Contig An03c0020, genomic contig n=2 Tax=Aspergillus niger TaxID=5061 RepID=A2QFR4_ASPNC|nr:uncharacterized protein An03g00470 [Aspergillus niger]CAK38024.1 unnamed protein product [Aspergillus niger]
MWTAIEQRDEASKAAYNSNVQLWTLYAIGCAVTLLRTYSQCKDLGWRRLRLDDYLIWVAILFYTAQVALAYSVGNVAHGLANNSMTEAQRATLDPGSAEYRERSVIQPRSGDWTLTDAVNRIIGSKIQIAGWATYTALINSLKLSMLVFYTRLMDGLGRRYRVPIWIGFALVIGSFVALSLRFATLNHNSRSWFSTRFLSTCHFEASDRRNLRRKSRHRPIFGFDTDPDALEIQPQACEKDCGDDSTWCGDVYSGEPNNGASIADEWGTRETFVAVITTNLPMVFHLLRTWLARGFGSAFQSSQRTYQLPSGGLQNTGGGTTRRRGRGGTSSRDPITVGLTFTESEERMMQDIKLQTLEPHEAPTAGAIMVSNQIEVTHQTRNSHAEEPSAPRENANW